MRTRLASAQAAELAMRAKTTSASENRLKVRIGATGSHTRPNPERRLPHVCVARLEIAA
jgi:hypothetical protein